MSGDSILVRNTNFKKINQIFNIGADFSIIAGPCAIESYNQLEKIAYMLAQNNINFIRAGAFKPRTSPYDFQGLGIDGLKMLHEVKEKYNLLAVSEIIDTRDVEAGMKYIDIIQVGSRNMQNFSLLKEIGESKHPVLLKRGMMATIEEFLYAAEYIVSNGNRNVILCERGIRTYETMTRNTLDISCIAIIKKETSLPIIVDLSHSLGRKDIIIPVAKAIMAMGVDGIMLEVHPNPMSALSDKKQQLSISEFIHVIKNINVEANNNEVSSTL